MKSSTFLVQAHNYTPQTISCSITDLFVRNLPVSVVFFYRKAVQPEALIDSLQKVLRDFPLFAGTLKNINDNLYIDCNNKGVLFSITQENCTLEQLLQELPLIKKTKLVHLINPKKVISLQSPLLTIQLTYFQGEGMALGVCWHHSLGDMHTFMSFMKAWSSTVNQEKYVLPLIVRERDEYLQNNLAKNNCVTSGVRYLNTRQFLRLLFYLLFRAGDQLSLHLYFSENELHNMKQDFSAKTQQNLSTNDVLCAHLFRIISELDNYPQSRHLSIAINYRARTKLPQNLLGNFVSSIHLTRNQRFSPFQLAQDLRTSVDNFQSAHMNFFPTKQYIEQNGGPKKIDRFIPQGINPVNRDLLISSWANFGVYDLIFGDSEPFYFTPFGNSPCPWLSIIVEGFAHHGLVYSASLPRKLAKQLMQEDSLSQIHKYRAPNEVMPEPSTKLGWLL